MAEYTEDFSGVRLQRKHPADHEPEMIDLFELDDVQYRVPRKVGYNFTMRAFEVMATQGELAAELFAMQELMGPDAYRALIEFDELEEDDVRKIQDVCATIVLGPKGNREARRRSARRAARGGSS